jgi:hypothetical protein
MLPARVLSPMLTQSRLPQEFVFCEATDRACFKYSHGSAILSTASGVFATLASDETSKSLMHDWTGEAEYYDPERGSEKDGSESRKDPFDRDVADRSNATREPFIPTTTKTQSRAKRQQRFCFSEGTIFVSLFCGFLFVAIRTPLLASVWKENQLGFEFSRSTFLCGLLLV